MSRTEVRTSDTSGDASAPGVDLKLEVVLIAVSDVDRSKQFYGSLGWRLDADFSIGDDLRIVQFTPPGSGCSIGFGRGVTTAAPGSAKGLELIVSDIVAARAASMSPTASSNRCAEPGSAVVRPFPNEIEQAECGGVN